MLPQGTAGALDSIGIRELSFLVVKPLAAVDRAVQERASVVVTLFDHEQFLTATSFNARRIVGVAYDKLPVTVLPFVAPIARRPQAKRSSTDSFASVALAAIKKLRQRAPSTVAPPVAIQDELVSALCDAGEEDNVDGDVDNSLEDMDSVDGDLDGSGNEGNVSEGEAFDDRPPVADGDGSIFEAAHAKFGIVERSGVLFDRKAGIQLGRIEFVSSSMLSFKAICLCGSHQGTSTSSSSSSMPPVAAPKKKGSPCYLLISGDIQVQRRYETCLEWLVEGQGYSHAAHLELAAEIRRRLKTERSAPSH
jgi:hypothetical protein